MKNSFITLFHRDLKSLYQEVEAYTDEAILWNTAEGISNPAGNLCLHLIGNLNEYIGRQLGEIPYERNRPLEFSATDVPQKDLLRMVASTQHVVERAIKKIKVRQFQAQYPENVLGYDMTIHYFLVHLHGHLTYHLGQINYHRRLLTSGNTVKFVHL
jgi:Protein of unknown function (DUF1572)